MTGSGAFGTITPLEPESRADKYIGENLGSPKSAVIKAKIHQSLVGSNQIDNYIIANGKGGVLESPIALIILATLFAILFILFLSLIVRHSTQCFAKCKNIFYTSKVWLKFVINKINLSMLLTLIASFFIIKLLTWMLNIIL
jgi:hypothetical protein